MASVVSRESYFETGLEVLSDLGYGGLKLAEVCNRLGVTTGSFYHYFSNWSAYTTDLVAHWVQVRTVGIIEAVQSESDPRVRIDRLISEALALPHGAEAAIRVWSSIDREVYAVQAAVDQQRFDVLRESALEILEIAKTRRAGSPRGGSTCWSATSRRWCHAITTTSPGSPASCSERWTRVGSARSPTPTDSAVTD